MATGLSPSHFLPCYLPFDRAASTGRDGCLPFISKAVEPRHHVKNGRGANWPIQTSPSGRRRIRHVPCSESTHCNQESFHEHNRHRGRSRTVTRTGTYTWDLTLYEERGTCWIKWSTNSPFRARQGRVCLVEGFFPSDPTKATAWSWDNENGQNYNTKQLWGAGWCAAYIAEKSPNGPYTYLAKTAVTRT